ncbi:fosfomycin resistance protein [Clostridium botulinum A1 str. CFSAN002368]|nr:fosfomycin resistance protein [Clostridium botulinum A1 str. CFSAN002368]
MIECISHITFVVKNLDKTTQLFKELFNAKEVYYSGEKSILYLKSVFLLLVVSG